MHTSSTLQKCKEINAWKNFSIWRHGVAKHFVACHAILFKAAWPIRVVFCNSKSTLKVLVL